MALRTPTKAIAAVLSVALLSVTFASGAQARTSLLERLREARENATVQQTSLTIRGREVDPRKLLLFVYTYRQWQSRRSGEE